MRKLLPFFVLMILVISACGPVTPNPVPLPIKPTASPTPIVAPDVWRYPGLEPITPGNVDKLQEITRWGKGKITDSALSPDGKLIAVSTPGSVYFYDTKTLDEIHFDIKFDSFKEKKLQQITAIAFTPDSQNIALAEAGRDVILWNLSTGKTNLEYMFLKTSGEVTNIQFSPDGNFVVLTSDLLGKNSGCEYQTGNIALYSTKEKGLLYNEYYCVPANMTFRFTSDNRLYIFLGAEQPYEFTTIETSTGNRLQTVKYDFTYQGETSTDKIYDVNTNGSVFAAMQINVGVVYKLLDAKTFRTIETTTGPIHFSANPNFRWVHLPAEGWELQNINGDSSCIFDGWTRKPEDGIPELLNPDGHTAFSVTNSVNLWDISICRVIKALGFINNADRITISPDGKYIAFEDYFHLYLQNAQTGEIKYAFPWDSVNRNIFAFSPDASKIYKFVRSIGDKNFKFVEIDLTTGKTIRVLSYETPSPFFVAIPTNDRIVFWDQNKVYLWNLREDKLIGDIVDNVSTFEVSSDQTEILIFKENYANPISTQIWRVDLKTGKLINKFFAPNARSTYYLSKESAVIFYESYNGAILNLENGNIQERFEEPENSSYSYSGFKLAAKNLFIVLFDNKWLQMRNLDNIFAKPKMLGKIPNLKDLWLSPDKQILVSIGSDTIEHSQRSFIQFWNAKTGEFLAEIQLDDSYLHPTVVFSPDGHFIAIENDDGIIRIWGVRKP